MANYHPKTTHYYTTSPSNIYTAAASERVAAGDFTVETTTLPYIGAVAVLSAGLGWPALA